MRNGWIRRQRLMGFLAATAFVMMLAGDRGAHTAPPPGAGVDPLAILDLQVRPNAIVVFDTSGSMNEGLDNTTLSDDHPRSKLYQAKQVLKDVIQDNEDKVSFQFGMFTQDTDMDLPSTERFLYYTTDSANVNYYVTGGGTATGLKLNRNAWGQNIRWTEDGTLYAHILADRFFNGGVWTVGADDSDWDSNGRDCGYVDGPDTNPPTLTMRVLQGDDNCDGAEIDTATFGFGGVRTWSFSHGCSGFRSVVDLAPCTMNTQFTGRLEPWLETGVLIENGNIVGYSESPYDEPDSLPSEGGLRAGGYTAIANSLMDLKTYWDNDLWPNTVNTTRQPTFAIILSDGDDTCPTKTGGGSIGTSADYDQRARRTAYRAEQLFNERLAGVSVSRVKTFVIAFGSGAQINRANWIAWGGSGLGQGQTGMPDVTVEDAGGDAARWADSYNNTSLLNLRNQCPNCLDAFGASSADELKDALQAAIDLGAGVGLWSASNSVWSSIFEYGASLGPFPTGHECEGRTMDPMEADDACTQRYRAFAWRQYKPSFEMPGYQGQVRANDENGFLWDAGQKLLDRMHDDLKGATTGRTFAQIKVNMIPRRIFTTNMNGIINAIASEVSSDFPTPGGGTSMTPVNLWTPDAGPDSGVMGGSLDAELGITDDLAYLQSEFGACVAVTGFDWGSHNCNSNVNQKLTAAKAEARQILLAFTAGVTPILSDGAPMRDASSREILYRARPWMLTESTLAAPGLVTQPSPMLPPTSFFETEYRYYMDRLPANANGVQKGFGLRNPDKGALVGSDSLKPVMSVVYVPGNDGLHAFRAGPCPASVAMCAGETGGEELWNFVPYDQLPKLKELRKTQSRDNHTYMMANNVEFSSVFVPGDYNATIDGQPIEGHGVWRTLLLAGRGAGGKHVSTLDITSRGPFTLAALDTNLPDVLWNRGNPDTRDGTTGGTDVRGDPHKTAYSKMGQTWSTPIVGRLPEGYSALYAAFMGSGYGDNAIEGKTFYVLNVLNGDVIHAIDDPESKPGYFQNVFLATPSIYQPSSLTSATTSPEAAVVTRVYFGDLQGRVWKFLTRDPGAGLILCTDLGIDHPIGVWSALMSIGDFAHIYVSTGHDVRVTPSPVFKAVVLKDNATDDLDVTVNNSTPLFTQEFPAPGVGKGHFRGSVDPQAVYWLDNNEAKPGVAIAANRYNPMTDQCRSSFDSIVYLFLSERSNDFDDVNVPAPAYREGEYITGLNIPTFVEDPDVVADDADTSTPDESGGSGGTGSIGVKAKKEPEGGTAAVHTRSVKNGSAVCRE